MNEQLCKKGHGWLELDGSCSACNKKIMSKQIDDGGPAFPSQNGVQYDPGMSLRDWFEGQALAGLLASGHFTKPCDKKENRCFSAYKFSDFSTDDPEDEDRPSATHVYESKKCREEYEDDVASSKLTYDCVFEARCIADAMIEARKPKP